MRRAQLVADAVAVLCPYCGEPQPNPRDGSEQWTLENFRARTTKRGRPIVAGRRTCVSCEAPMIIGPDTKVQFR